MKEENKKTIIVFLTLIIVVILDQITKVWAVNSLKETVPLIGNILKFQLTVNTGAGFGFLQGYNLLFIWIMIVIIGGILFYYDKIPEKSYLWFATGLILGGAIGNLIDRIHLGYVIDFIDFIYWPAFNIADSAITIAAVLVGIYIIFEDS